MKEKLMKTTLAIATAAFCALTFAATNASAGEAGGTFTGPLGGQWDVHKERHCSDGSCTYRRSVTGPWGNTRTREGTIRDTGDGWERRGTIRRRDGGTVTYGGSGRCYDGKCEYKGGRDGPHGKTRWSGEFDRY